MPEAGNESSAASAPLTMVHAPFCNKPDVRKVFGCECGANVYCATCHWGRGAMPCKCNREVGVNA